MCALVLALRKVPIFGPGDGPALGDHTNPTYSVTVSDEVAAAARAKAAKDADTARLHPVNTFVAEEKNETKTSSITEALAPIQEGIAADPSRDQEVENDAFSIVGDQRLTPSSAKESQVDSGSTTSLGKSKSAQGRRKPGVIAPTRTSELSQERFNLANVTSLQDSLDPEAQTSR